MFDTNFLLIVQIAIIGIILVAGMFLIWRAILRLEEKVDRVDRVDRVDQMPAMHAAATHAAAIPSVPIVADRDRYYDENAADTIEDEADEYEDDEEEYDYRSDPETMELMRSVFGDGDIAPSPLIVMFEGSKGRQSAPTITEIHEITEDADAPAPSENPTDDLSQVSKTKLKKMNMDQLKDYCMAHNLAIDGTKQQLIDRILM